jgi:hypothetical protein
MKPCYCIGRVTKIEEGYPYKQGMEKPVALTFSMEPNPYTPSFTASIQVAPDLAGDIRVGSRVRFDMRDATEEEWEAFKAAVSQPGAVGQ